MARQATGKQMHDLFKAAQSLVAPKEDDLYPEFLAGVSARAHGLIAAHKHVFTTDAAYLWETYLGSAPAGRRQERDCNTCRRFIQRFGGLVVIDDSGQTIPLFWADVAQPAYRHAAIDLWQRVRQAKVTGVFLSSENTWGEPVTGPWTHLSMPSSNVWSSKIKTAGQAMAEKLEEHGMLLRGLDEFKQSTFVQAFNLLKNGALYRAEKCEELAAFLLEAKNYRGDRPSRSLNLEWLAVAGAPAGWCHVKGGVIGTLLEDIQAGLSPNEIQRRWNEKLDPTRYQRPQAPPKAGNIAQAEKIIDVLEAGNALKRRFAKLDDVEKLWVPQQVARAGTGTFAHLKRQAITDGGRGPTMTWEKFQRTALPTAAKIEFMVPHGGNYCAMVTAADERAPKLMQWDNHVSWYVYTTLSASQNWGLQPFQWAEVTALVLQPSMWGDKPLTHHGQSVTLVLKGAMDSQYIRGAGFFPECLRSEYHPVRSTLEAYARDAVIAGKTAAEVCGMRLQAGSSWDCTVRVTDVSGMRTIYKLDRWD